MADPHSSLPFLLVDYTLASIHLPLKDLLCSSSRTLSQMAVVSISESSIYLLALKMYLVLLSCDDGKRWESEMRLLLSHSLSDSLSADHDGNRMAAHQLVLHLLEEKLRNNMNDKEIVLSMDWISILQPRLHLSQDGKGDRKIFYTTLNLFQRMAARKEFDLPCQVDLIHSLA